MPMFATLRLIVRRLWGPFTWRQSLLRISLMAAPWLVVLSISSLRPFLVHTDIVDLEGIWRGIQGTETDKETEEASTLAALIKRHPNDPAFEYYRLAQTRSSWGSPYYVVEESSTTTDTRKYDKFVQRFSHAPWVLAYRISVMSQVYILDERVAAPLETRSARPSVPYGSRLTTAAGPVADLSPSYAPLLPGTVPGAPAGAPPLPPSATAYQRRQQQHALASARKSARARRRREMERELKVALLGRKVEPENTYFDWYAARYLFSLWRDEEALAVLHEAAHKTQYDSHWREQYQSRRKVRQLLNQQSPQELLRSYTEISNYTQYETSGTDWAPFRHLVQLVVAHAARLEQRGEHARALAIYDDLMRLCIVMRNGSYLRDEARAACSFMAITWAGTTRRVRSKEVQAVDKKRHGETWLRLGARKFAAYAASHGRADLSHTALQEAGRFVPYLKSVTNRQGSYGIWPVRFNRSYYRLSVLLILIDAFILQWMVLLAYRFFIFFPLIPGGLQGGAVRCRDALLNVVPGVLVALAMAIAAISIFLAVEAMWRSGGPTSGTSRPPEELAAMLAVLAFTMPGFGGAISCAIATAWRQEKEQRKNGEGFRQRVWAKWRAMIALERPFNSFFPAASIASGIISWGTVGAAVVGTAVCLYLAVAWRTWISTPGASRVVLPYFGPTELIPVILVITIVCAPVGLLGWVIKWRWWPSPRWRASSHYALNWYRETLSWWGVAIGWGLLVVIVVAAQMFREVEQRFDAAIERGEVKTLLMQK